MKEHYMPSPELTRKAAYSTLDRTRPFERVLFAMDQKPPEDRAQRLREDRVRNSQDLIQKRGITVPTSLEEMQARSRATQAPSLEGGTVAPKREGTPHEGAAQSYREGQSLESMIKSIVAGGTGEQTDVARLILERLTNQTTQDEAEAQRALRDVMGERGQAMSASPYKYDAFNEVNVGDPPVEGPEGGESPRRRRNYEAEQEIYINPGVITHPNLARFVEEINALNDSKNMRELTQGLIGKIYEIQELPDNPADPEYMKQKHMLEARANTEFQKMSVKNERIGMYLQDDDKVELMVDPLGWLDGKFDQVYGIAMSGQELESPMIQQLQSLVGEAAQFLSRRFEKEFQAGNLESREKYEKFIDMFNKMQSNRISLLITRTNIDQKNMENVVGAYGRLRTEGLLGSLSFDDNKVGTMFNRILDYMETVRMAHGGVEQHITPIMMKKLQASIEEEQLDFAKRGIGIYKDEYVRARVRAQDQIDKMGGDGDIAGIADSFLKAEIRRAIRTGYDIAVSSQQVALRSARGKDLKTKLDAFSSDVVGAFGFFNARAFLVDKFNILNEEQEDLFAYQQMDLAENEEFNAKSGESTKTLTKKQLMERGRRMWRDMDAAPDFFSSGWRIKGILRQIEDVTKYKIQNEEIVKGLISGQGEEQMRAKYERYIEAYKRSTKWKVSLGAKRIDMPTSSQQDIEAAAKMDITRDFTQGKMHLDREDLESPLGMTLTERNKYISDHNLDSADIKKKAKDVSSNLGLFLRLKSTDASTEVLGADFLGGKKEKDGRDKVWKRIQKFKPEEMMRVMRERLDPQNTQDARTLRELNGVFSGAGGDYDKFKIKYGAVIHAIREDAMLNGSGQPLDIRDLNKPEFAKQRDTINKALNDPAATTNLVEAFGKLDRFVSSNDVMNKLLYSWQYEDVYKRTLLVDDAILSQLEYLPENSGLEKLSQIYSGEAGGDALKRNGNDFMNYAAASGFKVSILSKEGFESVIKDSEQFHQKVAAYEGPDAGARVFRYSAGTFMRYSLQDHWADLLQIGNLPFRMASSEIQRKFGYGQKPITAEDARQKLDHISAFLTGRNSKEHPHNAHKYYNQLEQLLRADGGSMFRDKAATISIYMILLLLLLPAAAAGKAVSEATH